MIGPKDKMAATSRKKVILNLGYSILIFFGLFALGVAIFDPSALGSDSPQVGPKLL